MRIRFLPLSVLVLLFCSTLAHAEIKPSYYLALGDSLAIGEQPSANGLVPTNHGYVDDLYAALRLIKPGLQLVKLGCSGETFQTMINCGVCNYAAGSQLNAAVEFLETHNVALVTLDIGANDVDTCVDISTLQVNEDCVTTGIGNVGTYLPQILTALRGAAKRGTPIFAMNYYDPFLAAWTLGASGQALAQGSLTATASFNTALQTAYQAFDVPVADVAKAYHITDFTPVPVINLPLNVFLEVTWTWAGAPAPLGPDPHPNAGGYAVIADAFAKKILSF